MTNMVKLYYNKASAQGLTVLGEPTENNLFIYI